MPTMLTTRSCLPASGRGGKAPYSHHPDYGLRPSSKLRCHEKTRPLAVARFFSLTQTSAVQTTPGSGTAWIRLRRIPTIVRVRQSTILRLLGDRTQHFHAGLNVKLLGAGHRDIPLVGTFLKHACSGPKPRSNLSQSPPRRKGVACGQYGRPQTRKEDHREALPPH